MNKALVKHAASDPFTTRTFAVAAIVLIMSALIARQCDGSTVARDGTEAVVLNEPLAAIPGKHLTAVRVDYEPAGRSPDLGYAKSVFVYVLSGAVRSHDPATGLPRVYRAGETFFERSGNTHLLSGNASTTERASVLALFVTDDGTNLAAASE